MATFVNRDCLNSEVSHDANSLLVYRSSLQWPTLLQPGTKYEIQDTLAVQRGQLEDKAILPIVLQVIPCSFLATSHAPRPHLFRHYRPNTAPQEHPMDINKVYKTTRCLILAPTLPMRTACPPAFALVT